MFIPGIWFLIIFMGVGAWYGWWRGIRHFLTITLASTIAYLMLVSGGGPILAAIDRMYTNLPVLLGLILQILSGNDFGLNSPWPSVFTSQVQLPVALRLIMFLAIVAVGVVFNKQSWTAPAKDTLSKLLGAVTGVLTALIWVSAASTFALQSGVQNQLLAIIPDPSGWIPGLMIFLAAIILASIVLNLPKLIKS